MGQKQSSEVPQHIFKADGPTSFSNELVGSLQNSPQSDTTRTKDLELKIQTRVHSELEKLAAEASTTLQRAQEALSAETTDTTSSSPDTSDSPSLTEKLSDAVSSQSTLNEKKRQRELSSRSVTKEIETLRKKLEARKKLEKPDEQVEKSKQALVQCLRSHDRRPLDCWAEVEEFKREVGRLEKEFVQKTVR